MIPAFFCSAPKEEKERRLSRPLAFFFFQTAFGTAFTYLTSGVFLSGLAILMGAGDTLVSYLSVIVNICGVLLLFFAGFMERFHSRKRLAVGLTVLSRLMTLFLVAIPAIVPGKWQLVLFVPAVIAAFTLQAQTTVVLNQWMLGFMDQTKSGRYISMRQTLTLSVTVLLSITSGAFLDGMNGQYKGFVLIFAAAAFMGACEVLLLARTPDGPVCPSAGCGCTLKQLISLPFQNRRFVGFVLYIFLFYLFLTVADSFTMVYMMRYLEMPYRTVNLMYMLISLPQVVLLGIWGRVSDRKGHQFVLKTSVWLFLGETLFMFFASPQSCYIFIPIAFLAASVANAGFAISVFNRRYELMPGENSIIYDNFYTAAVGLGSILGPMAGGMVKGWVESGTVLAQILPLANIRLLYMISTAGILFLQVAYMVQKKKTTGPAKKKGEERCR